MPTNRSPSDDQAFAQLADDCLSKLLRQLDDIDPDELDADHASGVLTMTFADGRKCIANRQAAAHQIWLAEGASAWHFARDDRTGQWLDTRGRGSLQQILSAILTERLGRPIEIS
ncbi:MAG: iron donor protein CyaY [Planctomycetota bacterium]